MEKRHLGIDRRKGRMFRQQRGTVGEPIHTIYRGKIDDLCEVEEERSVWGDFVDFTLFVSFVYIGFQAARAVLHYVSQ